jgi:hypothetical protein
VNFISLILLCFSSASLTTHSLSLFLSLLFPSHQINQVAPGSPFGGLKFFGNNFMSRLEGSIVNAPVLEKLTLIDSPGVSSFHVLHTLHTHELTPPVNIYIHMSIYVYV